MANAFIKERSKQGIALQSLETAFKNIGGCRACNTCWRQVQPVLSKMISMNWNHCWKARLFNLHAALLAVPFLPKLKAAIDKLYAYGGAEGLRKLAIKECYLFVCGGG